MQKNTHKPRGRHHDEHSGDTVEIPRKVHTDAVTIEHEMPDGRALAFLHSQLSRAFPFFEEDLNVTVGARGSKVFLNGDAEKVKRAITLITELTEINDSGYDVTLEDIRYAIRNIAGDGDSSIKTLFENTIPVSSKRKFITPKSETQREYLDAIKTNDIVIGIGPAGTGKTYLAMAMAINALNRKQVGRIILARPAVEAGERLGFLPGDLMEKVNPYLRPLYDALYDMMDAEKANRLIERGVIEIAPLAFMRGRTLNDSFIILDEAQNTTSEQMKMYLTRLGFNSKTVITGDVTQVDLPVGRISGLVEIQTILRDIEGIKFVLFKRRDVVRHRLVQSIVTAYERHTKKDDA
jgi:phosphate starvation-inducible PhoH-like protein